MASFTRCATLGNVSVLPPTPVPLCSVCKGPGACVANLSVSDAITLCCPLTGWLQAARPLTGPSWQRTRVVLLHPRFVVYYLRCFRVLLFPQCACIAPIVVDLSGGVLVGVDAEVMLCPRNNDHLLSSHDEHGLARCSCFPPHFAADSPSRSHAQRRNIERCC